MIPNQTELIERLRKIVWPIAIIIVASIAGAQLFVVAFEQDHRQRSEQHGQP
jgi:hypothetical protein